MSGCGNGLIDHVGRSGRFLPSTSSSTESFAWLSRPRFPAGSRSMGCEWGVEIVFLFRNVVVVSRSHGNVVERHIPHAHPPCFSKRLLSFEPCEPSYPVCELVTRHMLV